MSIFNHSETTNSSKDRHGNVPLEKLPSAVTQEFYNFIADIEDLIKNTTALNADDLEKLNDRLAKLKSSVESVSRSIVHRARHTAAVTNEYVHQQPWHVVGAGAALGLVLGLVLARRD